MPRVRTDRPRYADEAGHNGDKMNDAEAEYNRDAYGTPLGKSFRDRTIRGAAMIRNMHGIDRQAGEVWLVISDAGKSYHRTRHDAAYAIHGLLLLRASGWATLKRFQDGKEVNANAPA